MKKSISILVVMLAIMILCTACNPTPDGGANPKVLDTYEKYTSAIENVRKSDATGTVVVAYANKNTPWGCDLGLNNSYATPEFFATVDKAVKFDGYTIKVKMKGEPLKYVYICNSKHSDSAIDDAELVYRELN